MDREQACHMLQQNLKNRNLFKHCLAVEAVMRRLARHFGEDEEQWALAGLLHDIDYEETKDDPERHSLVGAEMLAREGCDDELVHAVRAHNEAHGEPRDTRMAQALYAVDPLTGLIVAAALIHPDKKLAAIDTGFVVNRFYEKGFARGARREGMQACSEMGLELDEFISLGLEAMQEEAEALGL